MICLIKMRSEEQIQIMHRGEIFSESFRENFQRICLEKYLIITNQKIIENYIITFIFPFFIFIATQKNTYDL